MLTELLRDQTFTIAWFGLMTGAWLGWGQEDPPEPWRWKLGAGSVVGLVIAGLFGYALVTRWNSATALEGKYWWFGLVVALEVIVAGVGCLVLARRGQSRWLAWWVALIVALHFLPLAFFLRDLSLAALAIIQTIGLLVLLPRLRRNTHPTSRLVGPVMGATLLLFAIASAILFGVRHGTPWAA
ncbi:hypothetical protein [Aestuariimicrobium ganziense]|uniref:hypothetical protein n=1 Tax=Aestuariimicrobium ganziense TaxID=2773677 RepID=UPI0019436F1E|nr:hypothetical protein [Aestuariimicrobium ganziense]